MRRFYAPPENFDQAKIVLTLEETRHLRDVLRLREKDEIRVFDGTGKEFSCEIEQIGKKETVLRLLKEVSPSAPESKLNLSLAVALLKGEKFDLVLQKAVELGVSKFIPLLTKRTDVKLNDAEKKSERWRKIVLESSKQCGRAKLMDIKMPVKFLDFVKTDVEKTILFSERGGETFSSIKGKADIRAIVGSEGGWDDSEIEAVRNNGGQIITLGGRILRAETAAIAIPALLQNHFGDLN